MSWARESLNLTLSIANPGEESPHKLWYGETAALQNFLFSELGYYHRERMAKPDPGGAVCCLLALAPCIPLGMVRILSRQSRAVVITVTCLE